MNWWSIPLRAIYRRVEERDQPDLAPLSVYRDLGVVPREGRDDNYNKLSDDLSAYKVVRPGDLVLNKMKTWQGSIGVSDYEGIVSPAYFIGRRISDADDRFMHHLLRSAPLIAEYGARSKGIRPSQWDLPWDEFMAIRVDVPPPATQHAIADYLDAETARIDALIGKKRRMVALVKERRKSALEAEFSHWPQVPLRRVAKRIDVGIAEAATHAYVLEGVPLLRSTNIKRHGLDVSDLLYIEPWFAERNRTKYVWGRDILTVRTGNAGISAVVPPELNGSQCFTQLITTLRDGEVPELICASLNYGEACHYFEKSSWGSAQSNISVPLLANAPVPDVPLPYRESVTAKVQEILKSCESLIGKLEVQIDLLVEHRQALITAAVTGELPIPGIAA